MKRNIFIPILLVVMFVGPMIAASIAYLCRDQLSFSSKSYGELIEPTPISFKKLYNTYLEPTKINHKKWHMIYIAPKICNTSCKTRIKLLHNGHLALHKYSDKIVAAVAYSDDLNIAINTESIIIVDPLGNYILQYSSEITPANVKKIVNDLKKLLRH